MKKFWIWCFLCLFSTQSLAKNLSTSFISAPQANPCITGKFSTTGNSYWKNVTLQLTNQCSSPVNLANTIITFKTQSAINTSFWGEFGELSYPEQPLNIISQQQPDGTYLATIKIHFPSYPGSRSQLPANSFIKIKYGVNSDTHMDGSVLVYTESTPPVETGKIVLKNMTIRPTGVLQTPTVHLTFKGTNIYTHQLPWNSNITATNLTPGDYTISSEDVKDNYGNIYRGSASPSSVKVLANQTAFSLITYTPVSQLGKIVIKTQPLPKELSGYTQKPNVLLRENQSGATTTAIANWNEETTVKQLKSGSTYSFSTQTIHFNGYQCVPNFNPDQLIANITAPTTQLIYQCTQNTENLITVKIEGAPTHLSSLVVTFTPNNNTAPKTSTVTLNNGKGTTTISLPEGVIYKITVDTIKDYTATINPSQLTSTANGSVSVQFTKNPTGTPVAMNGQLQVCGTQLCNEKKIPIQLKGMSTHGLQWYGEGKCITATSLDVLANQFKANVIRLSLYVQEGGYETNPIQFTQQVNRLIEQASNRGIYVIVDWHILTPGDPTYNLARAKQFFTDIATANSSRNNLLYEIANEPHGVSWATIKSYAEQIIPVIRALDNHSPIIVGTRGWSSLGLSEGSNYTEIVNNPVNFSNILYTFHFYAASHFDNYLNALDQASNVLPIFVTEFGTQTYSGGGENNFSMSDKYMQLMANKKIGWTNWNYSDDVLSGAIWKQGTCASNIWSDDRLKEAGIYIKNKISNP